MTRPEALRLPDPSRPLFGTAPAVWLWLGAVLVVGVMLYQVSSLVLGPPRARDIRLTWSIQPAELREFKGAELTADSALAHLRQLQKVAPPEPAQPTVVAPPASAPTAIRDAIAQLGAEIAPRGAGITPLANPMREPSEESQDSAGDSTQTPEVEA